MKASAPPCNAVSADCKAPTSVALLMAPKRTGACNWNQGGVGTLLLPLPLLLPLLLVPRGPSST